MQKIMGQMRKAITDYKMLSDGDKVCVGVSGGKDSVALLTGLAGLKRFIGIDFEMVAVTLDPQFGGDACDYSQIQSLCDTLKTQYIIKRTDIGSIVFDIRKESHPCSLCARMRRGALHDAAKELGCNKVALGHHKDDVIETFFMNLFNEGRIGCFSPVSYLSRKNLTLIRPLIYTDENDVVNAIARQGFSIVKSICPADGCTSRQKTKEYIIEKQREDIDFKNKIFGALKKSGIDRW